MATHTSCVKNNKPSNYCSVRVILSNNSSWQFSVKKIKTFSKNVTVTFTFVMSTILGKSKHGSNANVFCSLYNWSPFTATYSKSSDAHSNIGLKNGKYTLYKLILVHWIPLVT